MEPLDAFTGAATGLAEPEEGVMGSWSGCAVALPEE